MNHLQMKISDNLKQLHNYSVELGNTLNQLSVEMMEGKISWGELTKKGGNVFAKQVSNFSKDSFANIDKILENMQD